MSLNYENTMLSYLKYILLLQAICIVFARYEEQHRPCFFNSLCTCSNAGPDLGSVSCYHVTFTTIPSQIQFSAIYIMSLKYNELRLLEEHSLNGTGLWKLQINENLLTFLPRKALAGLEKTLSILNLSANRIAYFPKEATERLEKLQILNLANNHIATLHTDDLFQLGKTLKELDLSANSLSSIQNDAFKNMEALEILNLSENVLISISDVMLHSGFNRLKFLNLMDNQLEHIPLTVLATLKSIRRINLSKNFITSLNGDSGIVKKIYLEELNLEYNFIENISPTSFRAFLGIYRLNLKGNPIKSLNDSIFIDANSTEIILSNCVISDISERSFIGLENSLEILDLSFNELEVFPNIFFRKIQKLNLKGNQMATIDTETLKQIGGTLKYLDITGEKMGRISTDIIEFMPNIQYLNLKKDSFRKNENVGFNGMSPTLEELHLTRNGLTEIENAVFIYFSSLKVIDLSFNQISSIGDESFSGVSHSLTKLVLHKSISITEFPSQVFQHLTKLKHFDLSGNKLTKLPYDSFHGFNRLMFLNFNHNNLQEFDSSLLNERYNPFLEDISIAFNKLKMIQTNCYSNLKKVLKIDLNDNIISLIKKKAFVDLDSIREINLEGNLIKTIENDAFQNLPNIQIINFSRNKLSTFNLEAFDQVGRLSTLKIYVNRNQIQGLYRDEISRHKSSNIKVLDFAHNNISYLDGKYFQPVRHSLIILDLSNNKLNNLTNDALRHMEHLQVLHLSKNNISFIHDGFFLDLMRLQILNISENIIQNFTRNLFDGQNNLRIFDASKNKIQFLDEFLFEFTALERLVLSENQIENFPERTLCHVQRTLQYLDLSRNNIKVLNISNFKCIENLRQLIISHNLFHSVDGIILELKKLIVFDFSYNSLKEFSPFPSSPSSSKLEYLNLASTNISEIPVLQMPFLVSLNLSSNCIRNISSKSINNLENLQELDLSNNLLSSTYSQILSNLRQLRSLHINDNPILNLGNDSFSHLIKLQELYVQNLTLQAVDTGTFVPLRSLRKLEIDSYYNWTEQDRSQIFSGNRAVVEIILHVKENVLSSAFTNALPKSIRTLTLYGNQLLQLENDVLKYFTSNALSLSIYNTQMERLTNKLFQNMKNLQNLTLFLNNNTMTVLEKLSFSSASEVNNKRLVKVELTENDLICDCNIAWLWDWIVDFSYQQDCDESQCRREILESLRETSCFNKNDSFINVFKNDMTCFSGTNTISTNYNFLIYVFIEIVIFLSILNM